MDTRRDSGPAVGAEEKWFASGGTYRSTVVENRECGWSCISSNRVTIILQLFYNLVWGPWRVTQRSVCT